MNRGLPLRFAAAAKSYGEVQALKPTDLEVRDGEFLTLLGPSGSGKTTLLNLAAGYLEPSGGRIFIGERDVTDLPARRRNIGMVFQNYALFPHMTVAGNVAYGLTVRRRPRDEIARRVAAALAMVRLEEYGSRRIQELSGGQQQRVALARAIVIEPDVLLMDEPLGALDKQLRRQVQLELRRLHEEHRRTTIYVTHDQEEALVLSDRVAVMRDGRIEQLGSASDLYDKPVNAFVAGFIGESNLLPAKVTSLEGGEANVAIGAFAQNATVPAADGLNPGDDALLLIRPEHVRIDREGLAAEITEVVYLGELTAFHLRLAGGATLWGRQITNQALQRGMPVKVSWERAAARIVPKD
ncbi:ABC transporter ATP-binding protein [Taklimakanibacter lacteus]|uniref:ABC transporter ATP-binding protein n=1 Tax=Taklimakanibacter lacteus TaxID=2268456 RepID=UPI000E675BDC